MTTRTTALSTVLLTPFGDQLIASGLRAYQRAQILAHENGAPVGIWQRDGWYTVCEVAPDEVEPSPELSGWRLLSIVEPPFHLD